MADRLHNMRTLGSMLPSKQYKIAGETLYIYAPLAHRLGLFAIKTELEDLAFKYEHPEAYNQIKQKIAETEESRQQIYNNFSKPIVAKLKEMGLEFEMKARVKSIYSIWNKMESKHIPFEEVYDLYAVRIIFKCPNEADEKKRVLGHLLGHHRHLQTAPRTHPRLGEPPQSQWIQSSASHGHGSRWQLDRSTNTKRKNGRDRRTGIRRPLEIQSGKLRRRVGTRHLAENHQRHSRTPRAQRHRFSRHDKAQPVQYRDICLYAQRRAHHIAQRRHGTRFGFHSALRPRLPLYRRQSKSPASTAEPKTA